MIYPISRIIALLMAAVLCFVLLVPLALARHNTALAVFVAIVFFAYLFGNIALWQRMRRRG
ncbi:MAG: hypothetical protein JO190_09155 [Candidatus Eremiobacteraeota bacterium]|nr:hypothetical protein [Candidatus Eremiobacteraeota bacterium]MBV8497867.1 hypothetical protein [Candidatus Eremiobacteraeota bacterium]